LFFQSADGPKASEETKKQAETEQLMAERKSDTALRLTFAQEKGTIKGAADA
jgi:hypothetical protein